MKNNRGKSALPKIGSAPRRGAHWTVFVLATLLPSGVLYADTAAGAPVPPSESGVASPAAGAPSAPLTPVATIGAASDASIAPSAASGRLAQSGAAAPSAPAAAAGSSPSEGGRLKLYGSLRLREEFWDWFGASKANDYSFFDSLLRVGALYTSPHHDLDLELEQPTLLGLPRDASEAPPLGQLGFGGAYHDANGSKQMSAFIRQAFWRWKNAGSPNNSIRLGRFEYIDGSETTSKDPSLSWLKQERISHRLIGNFGFSTIQRSFDGGQFVHDTPKLNVTAMAGMPTVGVFDLNGATTIADVKVGYLAVTKPQVGKDLQAESRLFGVYYQDDRPGVVKTDNRPGPIRAADPSQIGLTTLGGDYVAVRKIGSGKLDGMLWGTYQFGDWGKQTDHAFAFAAEGGYQPKGLPWSPWLRAGYYEGSGDGHANDGEHNTYFPILPTPRVYARFPFFSLTNIDDAFVQLMLHPSPKVLVRSDVHFLSLNNDKDLWYTGGGAFQNGPSFGYSGRPSNGHSDLGTLADVSIDFKLRKATTLSGYFGYAFGGDVIRSIYKGGGDGFLGYVELSQKF